MPSQTSTGTIDLSPSGVVVARIRAGVIQSVSDARENVHVCVDVSSGTKRPLLVDISRCEPLEPEVRHFYSGEVLGESFLALGLLIGASPLGTMMGNVYLRIARPGIPTRLFTNESEAMTWLGAFLQR